MSLVKETKTDAQVLADGQIQVRTTNIIKEDGVEIARNYHRKVIDVGDDVSGEDSLVQDIASSVHTPARINARALAKSQGSLLDE